jgi:hypothetical protein
VEQAALRERGGNVQLRRHGVEEKSAAECHVSHGPELHHPCSLLSTKLPFDSSFLLLSNVLPKHLKPRSVLSLSFPSLTLMSSFSASPSITTSPPSSPHDLRHIISAGALTPQKDAVRERKLSAHASQHLGLRVGSRSPTSIPSSPTSVYVILIISPLNPPLAIRFFFGLCLSLPFYVALVQCRFLTIPVPVLL